MRTRNGGEVTLPSWEAALSEDLLGKGALNLMLINVSTRKFGRAYRRATCPRRRERGCPSRRYRAGS